MEPPLKLF